MYAAGGRQSGGASLVGRYTRRLAERVADGYAAKFERHHDQGGNPPLGFRRSDVPPHTLEVDPTTIGTAVSLFERYPIGTLSIERLARESGFEADRIRYILRNPLYNGWMRRHRGPDELRVAAPWRADPPISDALWARVVEVRGSKTRGGGPRNRGRTDLLAGLLQCVCGRRIRSDGRLGITNYVAKLHLDPCPAWGRKARLNAATWEGPILEQVGGLRIDDEMIAQVVGVLASRERPVTMDRARIERQLRDVALEHAAGRITDETYLARVRELRSAVADLDRETSAPASGRAVEWLRMFRQTWHEADVPEAKAELLHAIFERIVIAGPTFVRATLTPAAYQHGLALALPQAVMARPEGFEPPTY